MLERERKSFIGGRRSRRPGQSQPFTLFYLFPLRCDQIANEKERERGMRRTTHKNKKEAVAARDANRFHPPRTLRVPQPSITLPQNAQSSNPSSQSSSLRKPRSLQQPDEQSTTPRH